MRRCSVCGEDIAAHTRRAVSVLELRMIQSTSRNLHEAKSLTRAASRVCPLVAHREENGMSVFRVQREADHSFREAA